MVVVVLGQLMEREVLSVRCLVAAAAFAAGGVVGFVVVGLCSLMEEQVFDCLIRI